MGDWATSKQEMRNPGDFLKVLLSYEADCYPEETIRRLEPYISNPDFVPGVVTRSSLACRDLCRWCHAVYSFCKVIAELDTDEVPKQDDAQAGDQVGHVDPGG